MNQLIKSKSGKNHLIIRKIGLGGQGEAMECLEQTQKTRWVLKLYHPRFITKETKKRLYWLVRQRLSSRCPILKAPEDIYDKFKSNKLGHFTPMIPGQSLEEFLQNPVGSMIEKLKIALAITHAVDILHNLGIAHGDLQSNNILLVLKNGSSGFEVFIIDFDNFYVRGLPPPSCSGHKLYMPPECRNGGIPFIKSDLFNLAVIMHELILLMHIATGFDSDEKQFEATMISGVWQHDPMFTQANQKTAGLQSTIRLIFSMQI